MSIMDIAPATVETATGIATVHVRSWQEAYAGILDGEFLQRLSIEERAGRWREILQKSESRTLVASRGERVLGFVSYGGCRDEGAPQNQGEIWALYAEPAVWGQGVGRSLMQRAVQGLRSLGYTSTSLWVLSQNERGVKFYEAFGFEHTPGSEKLFELGGRQVEEVRLLLRHGG